MTTGSVQPSVTIILTIILLVLFFVGFFSIYFCRCFMENFLCSWYLRHSTTETPVGPANPKVDPGLDPSILQSFPIFTYSTVKDLRKERYGLECAICLSEFADDDILRLFTGCCHVFHQECIDLWLESHKTCPVCRRCLVAPEKSPTRPATNGAMQDIDEDEAMEDDNDEERGGAAPGTANSSEQTEKQNKVEKIARSHSTGHSIVRTRGGEDRFTLRLPEHLHAKLFRGHNWTGSCTTFGEYKSKTSAGNGGFGEVSEFCGGDVKRV